MTKKELRNDENYLQAKNKIENYSRGFKFTINFSRIPIAKRNALQILLSDCCKEGLIESVSIGYSLEDLVSGNITEETYRKL